MIESYLLRRITQRPDVFGGKPIIRDRRLAVEHVLEMLAAGDTPEDLLVAYPWLEPDDIRACFAYAGRLLAGDAPMLPEAIKLPRAPSAWLTL